MIKEFSFGNFRSFKEIQTLNLTASKINELSETNIIVLNKKESLLKTKAIYGANASGKSNIVKAFLSFIQIVKSSVKDDKTLQLIDSFKLSTETENEPAFFQLIFDVDNIQYRYGFEATNTEIKSEWLYGTPNEREVVYFIREKNSIIEISEKHFSEGQKLISFFKERGADNDVFRNDSLFLSTNATMNGPISKQIVNTIGSIIVLSGLKEKLLSNVARLYLDNIENKNTIINFLKFADTGINSLNDIKLSKDDIKKATPDEFINEIENGNEIRMLLSNHNKYNSEKKIIGEENLHFYSSQSEGTIKLFELSPFIINAISEGKPIIIDEFDARFHPLISKRIVELFNSSQNKTSQLIFITHDTNLLSADLLRRDQIDFVEKDKYGESHLYSLVQFKGIRNNASFQKDYIKGKYGAIPFLGDFNQLFRTDKDA